MGLTTVLSLVVLVAVIAAVATVASRLEKKMSGAHYRQDLGADDTGCAACGHAEVLELAPGAYLCPSCGYEGGPNLAQVKWQAEMATLRERSEEEQAEVRRAALEEGRLLTTVAAGELRNAADLRAKANAIRGTTKEARAHRAELYAMAEKAIGDAVAPTLEAISLLQTVEFLASGSTTLMPFRKAIVNASNVEMERTTTLAALQQLQGILDRG